MQNGKYIFYVKVNDKKTHEYEHGGETFIEGRKGSEYELFFKNNTHKRLLVVFSVDGLSVMDGKTASDKSHGYVVDAYREITIPGWKIDSRKAAKFQFRPQQDKANTTYVELLQEEGFDVDASNQGVIGCMVFEEVEKPVTTYTGIRHYPYYPNPWNQPLVPLVPMWNSSVLGDGTTTALGMNASSMVATSSPQSFDGVASASLNNVVSQNYYEPVFEEKSLGTGFGDDVKFETTKVDFERKGNPEWVAIINYDTIQGLRKRGIFINNSPTAKAFPGFKDEGCYVPTKRR